MKKYLRAIPLLMIAAVMVMPAGAFAQEDVSPRNAQRAERDALRTERDAFRADVKTKRDAIRDVAAEDKGAAKEQRDELRNTSIDTRKELLNRAIDFQIKHLESAKSRINNLENISDDVKKGVITELDAFILTLNGMKDKVASIETMEDLKAVTGELRSLIKEHKGLIKRLVNTLKAGRGEHLLEKANRRVDAISAKLDEFASQGVDVSVPQADLESAKADFATAESLIASDIKAAIAAFKEGYQHLKDLVTHVREIDKSSPEPAS